MKPFRQKFWPKLDPKPFPPNQFPPTDSKKVFKLFRNDLVEIGGVSPQITADKMG